MGKGQLVIVLMHVLLSTFCFGGLEPGDDELLASSHGLDIGSVADEPAAKGHCDLPAQALAVTQDLDLLPWKEGFVGDDVALYVREVGHQVLVTMLVVQRALDEMVDTGVPRFPCTDLLEFLLFAFPLGGVVSRILLAEVDNIHIVLELGGLPLLRWGAGGGDGRAAFRACLRAVPRKVGVRSKGKLNGFSGAGDALLEDGERWSFGRLV